MLGILSNFEGEKGTGKGKRRTLLLVNKADLLTKAQRTTWADYFDANNVRFAFYSAANASALQEKLLQNENGERQEGSDTPDGQSGTETSGPETSEPSTDSEPDVGAINEVQDESDERIRVLSVQELEELFIKTAPPLSDFTDSEGKSPTKLTVGLVGYPNVGKSSTINSLLGAKKVSVSSTPGKTKHFQTIHLSPDLLLCDCPGLVFPQFATTKAELVCDGVLPIDQMREYRGPVGLVTQRISRPVLEATYGLTLRRRGEEEGGDGSDAVLAEDLLVAYAIARGYARAGQGNPDESRAARYILKDYVNAKLLYCHPPPDADGREFNNETSEIRLRKMLGRKRAPVTRVGKGADTAPDVSHILDKNESLETEEPAPIQSNKSRTLDREFFDSQAIGSRPYVKGGSRDGHGITRVRLYPHQNSVADDGRPLGATAAKVASVLEASGLQGPGSDKKHYKMKRGKQRSGKGYD
ncbi:hypothetical protein FRC15_010800 [Serendipita sp. 397]|nr:hypothetical protein FRC15_010800 [Serendipita sp. 397]